MLEVLQLGMDYAVGMSLAVGLAALGVLVGWALLHAVQVLFGKGRGR